MHIFVDQMGLDKVGLDEMGINLYEGLGKQD